MRKRTERKLVEKANGIKAVNPIGECFDSTALIFMKQFNEFAIVCHGIGIRNIPGLPPCKMAHAWIEYNGEAYDTTWGRRYSNMKYRMDFKIEYLVKYTKAEFMKRWVGTDYPGPWDEKIKEVIKNATD